MVRSTHHCILCAYRNVYCPPLNLAVATYCRSCHWAPPYNADRRSCFPDLPIADQYDMRAVHMWCRTAVNEAPLDLWPSAPIASSQVPKHPGLLQWLALADSKQCTPLVESCLSQLLCQESDEAIHEAVASPHLRQLIDGLRPGTKTSIICKMAGLPLGFQVF